MKVLIGCIFFRDYTGSELYVYELANKLLTMDCEVHVISAHIGGPLTDLAASKGIKVHHLSNAPKIAFDIIHTQHVPMTENLIAIYPLTDKITTIHSEVLSLENPVLHPTVKRFVAIRPEIKQHLVEQFHIDPSLIDVIYNPIDETRFKPLNLPSENTVLFVGSLESLRRAALYDLAEDTKAREKNMLIVGRNHSNYLSDILHKYPHVRHVDATRNVEEHIHKCDETAGILLGRTTIEGWLCNKPGWIYDVDFNGTIRGKKFYEVPDDLEKYHAINVATKIKKIYDTIVYDNSNNVIQL